ncbi:hypothetical protein [Sphingomonas lenta]|uniref:Uncharacterized protein n=1 Tax=Sphingomonas lenta TaxID=1141887 RepID=A0A2A2SC53_9SPHN|nr:hypothetical protein [Sphingomonas lenta]PAX06836.1 hypothetical protein CKY28_12195 [Sphingomonas lenta]
MRAVPLILLLAACAEERAPEPAPSAPIVGAVPPKAVLPSPTPSASPRSVAALTAEGWGPLRVGMTRAQVEAALGPDAEPNAVGGPEPDRCDQFRPARAPEGLIVMIEDGRLTRVSLVEGAALRTDRGLGLGATAAQVRAAYGRSLDEKPHAYAHPPGLYLTHWATRGTGDAPDADHLAATDARGIRYETGATGRVEAIHAGGPSIQYVEGCS